MRKLILYYSEPHIINISPLLLFSYIRIYFNYIVNRVHIDRSITRNYVDLCRDMSSTHRNRSIRLFIWFYVYLLALTYCS